MSDLPADTGMNTSNSLATALRGLAQVQPETSAWPALQASLLPRQKSVRSRWRYALPAALAAGIALFFTLPILRADKTVLPMATTAIHADDTVTAASNSSAATAPETTPNGTDAKTQIEALRQQSQVLERWLSAARNSNSSARDLLASSEIEDMIGLVDVQLSAGDLHTETLPLWRQRVSLLQDLAALRYTGASLAANGMSSEIMLASPTSWTN